MSETTDQSAETDDSWFSAEAATFGDRLAGAREAMGMSQGELAKRLGVKLKTIRVWEEDLQEPRANKLQMLSGILNVSMRWMLTGEGEGLSGPVDEVELPGEVSDLLSDLRQLKSEMSRSAEKLAMLEKRLRSALKAQG
ncbi:multiprotein-bridging factor 1 family protein [Pseudoruegeria sp. SHC-113]|uniref:helix-turn-helix domain-containing protein n=1 Tax=Pseudoruegeria sp. SHC-113 TaxID=2855439 RepID=UPI0021BB5A08|nr:helix-turn-helix domain-containing protein [Pseudoruegeria sp. SHC-113]MCT8161060.1 helix-turn-helix domain-containing protein [Pseudoruegeria sp. SHC-113]